MSSSWINLSNQLNPMPSGITRRCLDMAVPKSKVSKQRRDKRRANWKLAAPAVTTCPKCGAFRLPHRMCKACMTYDGKTFGQAEAE